MAPENDSPRRDKKRGKRIRDARLREGLTPAELAARMDGARLHPTAADVAGWEAGEPVSSRVLPALARALRESQRHLDTGEEDSGVRIARRRAQKGLSQEQLASALGISSRKLQYWESGTHPSVQDQLDALARELDASSEYILTGEPLPSPADADAGDQRDEGRRMSGGFHDVASLVAGIRGKDPDASISELRSDVQELREDVNALTRATFDLLSQLQELGVLGEAAADPGKNGESAGEGPAAGSP